MHIKTVFLIASLAFFSGCEKVQDIIHESTTPDSEQPKVISDAEKREIERQNSTWTSENIQKNPYLFLQDKVRECDTLKSKLEAQIITFNRIKNTATRSLEEDRAMIDRCNQFLNVARTQYLKAEERNSFPIEINGYLLEKEELEEKIADALERVSLCKKRITSNTQLKKKMDSQLSLLKPSIRKISNLKQDLLFQAEQVKLKQTISGIDGIHDTLNTIKDTITGMNPEAEKISIDEILTPATNDQRKDSVSAFLHGTTLEGDDVTK